MHIERWSRPGKPRRLFCCTHSTQGRSVSCQGRGLRSLDLCRWGSTTRTPRYFSTIVIVIQCMMMNSNPEDKPHNIDMFTQKNHISQITTAYIWSFFGAYLRPSHIIDARVFHANPVDKPCRSTATDSVVSGESNGTPQALDRKAPFS